MNLAEPIQIGKFFKNRKGDVIVVQIKQFEGVVFCDIRQFFQNETGVTCPTKKGVAVSLLRLEELAGSSIKRSPRRASSGSSTINQATEVKMMTDTELKQWLADRKEAGKKIDVATCEITWWHGQIVDPYGVHQLTPEEECAGRLVFVRSPESDGWVSL